MKSRSGGASSTSGAASSSANSHRYSSILTSSGAPPIFDSCGSRASGPTTVTWAPTPTLPSHQKQQQQQNSEVDRIMAKIEQARLSIANVCGRKQTLTTTTTKNKKLTFS